MGALLGISSAAFACVSTFPCRCFCRKYSYHDLMDAHCCKTSCTRRVRGAPCLFESWSMLFLHGIRFANFLVARIVRCDTVFYAIVIYIANAKFIFNRLELPSWTSFLHCLCNFVARIAPLHVRPFLHFSLVRFSEKFEMPG